MTIRVNALLTACGLALLPGPASASPTLQFTTSKGVIVLELDSAKAPITVANFMQYVGSGFYTETIFHRVIRNFMVQGGGHTENMAKKPVRPAIRNEASNGLKNLRGTIAMARETAPHSATSQFYINHVNNPNLDFKDTTTAGWGYCVFGKVVSGLPVIDSIAAVPTTTRGSYANVPVTPILVTRVSDVPTRLGQGGKAVPPAFSRLRILPTGVVLLRRNPDAIRISGLDGKSIRLGQESQIPRMFPGL